MLRTTRLTAIVLILQILLATMAGATDFVVPSSQCRGLFIVPINWYGGTLDMVLDTGASLTTVDPDAYQKITGRKLKSGKKVSLKSGQAGPLKLNKIKARLHELDHIGLALGRSIDGILGFNTFHKLLLTLDYPNGEVRVGTGELPEIDGVQIFQDVGKTRPFLMVDIGGALVPVLIDSGSAGGLDLRVSDSTDWKVMPVPYSAAVRYSEIVIKRVGRLAGNYYFGPLKLLEPLVTVTKGTRLAGAKVLQGFTLVFDHRNDRIRMSHKDVEPQSFDSLYGWGFGLRPRITGMEIIEVFSESAAALAGLNKGDLITAVDGVPVHERGCSGMNDETSRQTVVFSIHRDGKDEEVSLTSTMVVP
jgi:hypothetical protein